MTRHHTSSRASEAARWPGSKLFQGAKQPRCGGIWQDTVRPDSQHSVQDFHAVDQMTQLPATRAHELDLTDGWLRIRFDRPAQRNALSANSVAELTDVLESVRHDRSVRGISFRGNGGVFRAGGDLQEFSEITSAGARTESRALSVSHGAARLFECIDTAPQLSLSLIEGAAIGGGLGIACANREPSVIRGQFTYFVASEQRDSNT